MLLSMYDITLKKNKNQPNTKPQAFSWYFPWLDKEIRYHFLSKQGSAARVTLTLHLTTD